MRKLSFAAVLLAIMFLFAEIGSFAVSLAAPSLFDHREFVFSHKFNERKRATFVKYAADSSLGWDNPRNHTRTRENCIGDPKTEAFGAFRQRVHSDFPAEDAIVVVAGDSYTHGDDVDDHETFPAALERSLEIPVANLGVGGFGPTQALLKLEGSIENFPSTKVVILSIMHDNLFRMVNSYRPVYFPKTGIAFGFKPFMKDGNLHPMIAASPWKDIETARKFAHLAFDSDHWRKPVATFPFTSALTQIFFLPAGRDKILSGLAPIVGKSRYEMVFEPLGLERNLIALLDRFHRFAQGRQLAGIVALVPRNGDDTTAGPYILNRLRANMPAELEFVAVGQGIDWSRYNINPNGSCHPSPYGYSKIAEALIPAIRSLLEK